MRSRAGKSIQAALKSKQPEAWNQIRQSNLPVLSRKLFTGISIIDFSRASDIHLTACEYNRPSRTNELSVSSGPLVLQ
jgi:hypothetical protein